MRIMSANTTAISYINKKGNLKSHECHKVEKEIWTWFTSRALHIVQHTFQAKIISRKTINLENFKMQLKGS